MINFESKQTSSGLRRDFQIVVLSLIILFCSSTILLSFHFHTDFQTHSTCILCQAQDMVPDTVAAYALFIAFSFLLTLILISFQTLTIMFVPHFASRGPPLENAATLNTAEFFPQLNVSCRLTI